MLTAVALTAVSWKSIVPAPYASQKMVVRKASSERVESCARVQTENGRAKILGLLCRP